MTVDATKSEQSLRRLVDAIVGNDHKAFTKLLKDSPELAAASFCHGATRQNVENSFIEGLGLYLYSGDTALHVAAAGYREAMVKELLNAGANVRAKNRRGGEPLHAAAVGSPGSVRWNPTAQSGTIVSLIEAGADPNAKNMDGATPLHRAVRTRCAEAVHALLTHGADPGIRNKSGSTALQLAAHTTGRGGTGSAEAKAQQQEIKNLLESH